MNGHALGILALGLGGLGLVVYILHKIGKALAGLVEILAAAVFVFLAIGWLVKAVVWLGRQVVLRWRTSLTLLGVAGWVFLAGWLSLAIVAVSLAAGLLSWRLADLPSFDRWVGRWLRSWWQRWVVYARHLPAWLHACDLTVTDDALPVTVTVNLVGRKVSRDRAPSAVQVPKLLGVRSGPSWDEVRVKLVAGQKPEDYDDAARALAVARNVARCQVRELAPNVVSIDFQRRNLLVDVVACPALDPQIDGTAVDLDRVWSGRTEYGRDWHVRLAGGHVLVAGATGAGKNSLLWCPLVSIAPAIRDGLVRVSGIDPKGMELSYGRRVFHRYAVTGPDALALLDDLVTEMTARKATFAGRVRSVPISREHPLELLEFDEIAALTRYTDRKTREQISERVAVLTTQGRALGVTVRGYVQEPTKDTIPVRELFPRRICLRVTSKTHVGMVLGDQAYERGAWANRIGEDDPGVGYVFGDGVREPLRVRAGWVPDETVKALETFVAGGSGAVERRAA
jgi:S-DNA-T family DNA segregation ATPase FtsK/SpoIIIE